jgi:hypothetical protein
MGASQDNSDLYVPYCAEREGHSQPIGTALSLNAGKHMCQEHFLKRCRTVRQLLTQQQRTELPAAMLDKISLEWSETASGGYEGRPQGCEAPAFAALTSSIYKLQPTG